MKILLIAWYFPPANTIAALRLSKLAAHLIAEGHDVRVITARNVRAPQGLAGDLDGARVTATPWIDVKGLSGRAMKALKKRLPGSSGPARAVSAEAAPSGHGAPGDTTPTAAEAPRTFRRTMRELMFFPDFAMGWIPHALRAGHALARDWQPDLVYASGPPFSTLVIGWRLARRLKAPLITEFRDRWSDDPYYPPSALRQWLDRKTEARIVRDAAGVVTVSEPWAAAYRARFGKPVHVLYNGYDPDRIDPALAERSTGGPLRIVYTGQIYPGRRDPSLLFDAIARLGSDPADIAVDFYGTQPAHVWPLADRYGVRTCVRVHPPVLQPEAVRRQLEADVLLLMQWQDPREQGNVPGKLFEYLGARRPILLIGLEGGVPHSFIHSRGAGALARDPDHAAELLRGWLAQKRETGHVPLLPEDVAAGLTYSEQFAALPGFLESSAGSDAAAPHTGRTA